MEKKRYLYIYFILLLLPSIFSQIGGFSPSQEEIANTYEQGTLVNKIFYPLLLIWSVYAVKTQKRKFFWTRFEVILIAYLALGVFYSPSPDIVLRGTFTMITMLIAWNIMAQKLSTGYSLDEILHGFLRFMVIYGSIESFFWLTNQTRVSIYDDSWHFIGYFQHSNLFAKTISVGILLNIFYLTSVNAKEIKYWIYLGIQTFFLIGSGSRTSLLAVVASTIVTILFTMKIKWKYKFAFLAFSLGAYLSLQSFFSDFFSKTDNVGSTNVMDAGSIVYRMNMWDVLLPAMMNNFWFGVGLNSFWTRSILLDFGIEVAGIHNGYLQVFQDLGIIGLAIMLLIHLPLIRNLGKKGTIEGPHKALKNFLIALWIFFLIVNITEGDLGNYRSSLWAFLIVFSVLYLSYQSHAQTQHLLALEEPILK